jgi:hypothetical protein
MDIKTNSLFKNLADQWYIKIIVIIIIAGLTIWLCDNFPNLLKQLINFIS